MSAVRKLGVDTEKCIGCQACTNVCPAKLISFSDGEVERTLQFTVTCTEECTKCEDACSEKALALVQVDKAIEGTYSIKFPLACCADCGTPYATKQMMNKLYDSIPALLDDQDWLNTCPVCRQTAEAKNIASRGLLSRIKARSS
jgi:Pyruvate/2-oxoacid:ferredoxin oxidoreductase delta subunit